MNLQLDHGKPDSELTSCATDPAGISELSAVFWTAAASEARRRFGFRRSERAPNLKRRSRLGIAQISKREDPRIPKGFRPPAQGWREAPTLGRSSYTSLNPEGVVAWLRSTNSTPLGLGFLLTDFPRVARACLRRVRRGRQASQSWASLRNPFGILEKTLTARV